jgi:hypothetical protein
MIHLVQQYTPDNQIFASFQNLTIFASLLLLHIESFRFCHCSHGNSRHDVSIVEKIEPVLEPWQLLGHQVSGLTAGSSGSIAEPAY